MEKIRLTIDGKNILSSIGTSLLNAASENGIHIPTLCHHVHLEPAGACRLCIVEDEKSGRLLASCVTTVSPDMSIRTGSPTVRAHRKNIVRLMLANHPESCIVCDKGNRCELRKIAAELGVGLNDLYPMPHYTGIEAANPFIVRDLSKCILCGKCVRADHELVVVGAIDYNQRGFESRPATVHAMPLEKSSCTFCGTCVSLCPTGALMTKNEHYVGSPQKEVISVCGFCGVGCSLVMGAVDNRIVDVNPSHDPGTVNRSTLCVRGHFAHDFLNSSRRLTSPLMRKDGEHCATTWEEALDAVAEKLLSIKREHGPQSLAFYGSSKCSIEENYLFQKIARVLFGTNNVDNGGYFSGRSRLSRIHQRLHGGGRRMPLNALEKAEAILVIGANPNESSPVVSYYLKRASALKGLPIVVVDPRKTALVPFSKIRLAPTLHRDDALINALAAILHQRNAYDIDFIHRYTRGFEGFFESLSSLNMERLAQFTGVDIREMERAAEELAGKRLAFVVGHGILQQRNGLEAVDCLLNLALMTGSLGKEGSGFYFPAGENNEMGAWDMGASPDFLPGRLLVNDDAARRRWEGAWRVKLSPDPGLNIVRMIEEAGEGNLKALYVMGENPCRSLPQPGQIYKAFGNLEFLVVQDILENETTALADVVLPGAAFSEKEGAFTNMEGRVQPFRPVVSPPGDAKADWEILDLLGSRMGFSGQYKSLQRIRDEMKQLIPMYSDMRRDDEPSWVAERSNLALFDPDGRGDLLPFSPIPEPDEGIQEEERPFQAILGTVKYHLGSGTRTGISERIQSLALEGAVEISSDDARLLGIEEGNSVRISSTYGTIKRRVKVERNLKPGRIFIPRAFHQNDVRNLLALTTLESPRSPGFKEINVKVEKVKDPSARL